MVEIYTIQNLSYLSHLWDQVTFHAMPSCLLIIWPWCLYQSEVLSLENIIYPQYKTVWWFFAILQHFEEIFALKTLKTHILRFGHNWRNFSKIQCPAWYLHNRWFHRLILRSMSDMDMSSHLWFSGSVGIHTHIKFQS